MLLRRKQRNKPLESKGLDGSEADGVFAGNTNQRYAPEDPNVPCVMKSDVPLRSSKLWQAENPAGSLAAPVKFSSSLGSSCRLEYEEDRSSSQASRSQPPRHYNGRQRSDSVSERASKGVGYIINTLRDSFGQVRV